MASYGMPKKTPHHKHVLVQAYVNVPFICDGCQEVGHGPRYCCEPCKFHLHNLCTGAFGSRVHAKFVNSDLKLLQASRTSVLCDACGTEVKGYVCQSSEQERCKVSLHPCCVELPPIMRTVDGRELELIRRLTSKCDICNEKIFCGISDIWGYASRGGMWMAHVPCVKKTLISQYEARMLRSPVQQREPVYNYDERAIVTVSTMPRLGIIVPSGKKVWKFKNFGKIAKVFFSMICCVLTGQTIDAYKLYADVFF